MASTNRDFDQWDRFANLLFLAYVRDRLGKAPRAWGTPPDYMALKLNHSSIWHTQQAESTRLAVARKNQFRDAMAAMPEVPSKADIRDLWDNAMRLAESDISAHLAASA